MSALRSAARKIVGRSLLQKPPAVGLQQQQLLLRRLPSGGAGLLGRPPVVWSRPRLFSSGNGEQHYYEDRWNGMPAAELIGKQAEKTSEQLLNIALTSMDSSSKAEMIRVMRARLGSLLANKSRTDAETSEVVGLLMFLIAVRSARRARRLKFFLLAGFPAMAGICYWRSNRAQAVSEEKGIEQEAK